MEAAVEKPPPEGLMGPIQEAASAMFPNICPDYLAELAFDHGYDVHNVIGAICEAIEKGKPYPKQKQAALKRKRSDSTDNSVDKFAKFAKLYTNPEHQQGHDYNTYRSLSKTLILQDFPLIYSKDYDIIFRTQGNSLFKTYMHLSAQSLGWDGARPAGRLKKKAEKGNRIYERGRIDQTIEECDAESTRAILEEFRIAREIHDERTNTKNAEEQARKAEVDNVERAKQEGTMAECGCCMEDFPMNRMVHCQATTSALHWFCKSCARQNAETAIGYQKHDFKCMSMDGCDEGFGRDQIALFLDPKTITALERIEMENELRMSGIENLESCPFCPFAAECAPIAEDREFRCQNEECRIVSCRLCREETHIPQTCEEAARDRGVSARRKIEEAMSAALIRKCNKCGTSFIKEHGCNKMTCSKCGNRQCYICGKSCEYAHFDDPSRGGKSGNCPLFDNNIGLEQRHQDEVRQAEEAARAAVQSENPDLDEDVLRIDVSDKVKGDEEKRRKHGGPARVVNFGMAPRPGRGAPENLNFDPGGLAYQQHHFGGNRLAQRQFGDLFFYGAVRDVQQRAQAQVEALMPVGVQEYDRAAAHALDMNIPVYDAILARGDPARIYVPDRAVPGAVTAEQRAEINARFAHFATGGHFANGALRTRFLRREPPVPPPGGLPPVHGPGMPPGLPRPGPPPPAQNQGIARHEGPGGQPENPIVLDGGDNARAQHQPIPHRHFEMARHHRLPIIPEPNRGAENQNNFLPPYIHPVERPNMDNNNWRDEFIPRWILMDVADEHLREAGLHGNIPRGHRSPPPPANS